MKYRALINVVYGAGPTFEREYALAGSLLRDDACEEDVLFLFEAGAIEGVQAEPAKPAKK